MPAPHAPPPQSHMWPTVSGSPPNYPGGSVCLGVGNRIMNGSNIGMNVGMGGAVGPSSHRGSPTGSPTNGNGLRRMNLGGQASPGGRRSKDKESGKDRGRGSYRCGKVREEGE